MGSTSHTRNGAGGDCNRAATGPAPVCIPAPTSNAGHGRDPRRGAGAVAAGRELTVAQVLMMMLL